MIINEKNIFIMDAIGATLSASLLGIILPIFFLEIGLSVTTLYFLAIFPLLYGAFSLYCHYFAAKKKRGLLVLLVANTLYCVLTSTVMAFYYNNIMLFGWIYLFAEIIIILTLVVFERNVYLRMNI
jgi:hypothetical protein